MIIGIYFIIIIIIGILNKVNIYESFLNGVKNGINTVLKMYPNLFILNLLIQVFITSNFLSLLNLNDLIIQMILKPISYSGSLVLMNNIYLKYSINSKVSILSSFIQFSSDTTLFIISAYLVGIFNINKSRIIKLGLLINLIGFIYSIIFTYLFNSF